MPISLLATAMILLTGNPGEVHSRSIYDFHVKSIEGKPVKLSEFSGKVALVVNTASKCGYTPQYKELEQVFEKYKAKGFVVLGFPSNDFKSQEPGSNAQIKKFCQLHYGVKFPLFEKAPVKGVTKQPLYEFLTEHTKPDIRGDIRWNFTKFLVNKKGEVVARFEPAVKPSDRKVVSSIEKLLLN